MRGVPSYFGASFFVNKQKKKSVKESMLCLM